MGLANKPRPLFVWTPGLLLFLWEIVDKVMEIRAVGQELHAVDPATFPAHESEEKTIEEAYSMVSKAYSTRE